MSVLCPGYVPTGILSSDRTRPGDLRGSAAPAPRAVAGGWSGGASDTATAVTVEPAEVAEKVEAPIFARRFWILTHSDAVARLRSRFEPMIGGTNPVLDPSAPGAKP